MQLMVTAILCGYYGMGNGGDEALLAILLDMLPSTVTPIVLSGDPAQTTATYGVQAVYRKSLPQVVGALRQADVFIWGGGSLMQDASSALNPLYYGGLMLLAQRMGLRTVAWAQGIGPLTRSLSQWITRVCLRDCDAVSVRDSRSAALLQQWGIEGQQAPDPVWALSSEPISDLSIGPKPRVAVILRPHASLTPERLDHLTQALIQFHHETHATLLLIPFQPINDRAIAEGIHAQLPQGSQIIELANPRQLHGLFTSVDFAIAMRLHGVIMAAAAGCRPWAISYDPKVTQLMQALDIPGWSLNALPTDSSVLCQAWVQQFYGGQGLSASQRTGLCDRAQHHRTLLHNVIDAVSSVE